MKIDTKKFVRFSLVVMAATSSTCFGSCELNDDQVGKTKTYTMEAEYVDLDDVIGTGISNAQTGVGVIYGEGTEAHKKRGWSNGYYVGYTYTSGFTLTFAFTSDGAETATIILRLASELGDIKLTDEEFSVMINDREIDYEKISVDGSPSLAEAEFYDKTVATAATLKEGENTISLIVNSNQLKNGQTGGPLIDCIKIQTKAALAWTDRKENPDKRGEI